MRKIISLAALIAGVCLIYLGYQRQQSIAGKTDNTLSSLGNKLDGGPHVTEQTEYYIAGAVLTVGGVVGLGLVRR
jgi:drug/metabolite transporter (DMT)-like permease